MKHPTTIPAFRRWLAEQFSVLETVCQLGEPSFFEQLDIYHTLEQAGILACRFGAGHLLEPLTPSVRPMDGLRVLGSLLAWSQQGKQSDLFTVGEVAEKLSVSTRSVWRMVSTAEIPPPIKIGGLSKWKRDDIQAMMDLKG